MSRLVIGTVSRAHGVKGMIRVVGSESLLDLSRLFVGGREFAVERAQAERGDALVKLRGVDDRDAAEALRGQRVEAERDDLPAPSGGEVYVSDLIGCQVFDVAGARLGEVRGSFPGGGHEVLEVDGGERAFLLPLVDAIVREVDVAARRIVCDPPVGLIDLDKAEQ
jgi:16S rRNA processing protein RimM